MRPTQIPENTRGRMLSGTRRPGPRTACPHRAVPDAVALSLLAPSHLPTLSSIAPASHTARPRHSPTVVRPALPRRCPLTRPTATPPPDRHPALPDCRHHLAADRCPFPWPTAGPSRGPPPPQTLSGPPRWDATHARHVGALSAARPHGAWGPQSYIFFFFFLARQILTTDYATRGDFCYWFVTVIIVTEI